MKKERLKKKRKKKKEKAYIKPNSVLCLQSAPAGTEAKEIFSLPTFCKVLLGRENTGQTVPCRRFWEIAPGALFATISWLFFIALEIKQSCKVLHKSTVLACKISASPLLC